MTVLLCVTLNISRLLFGTNGRWLLSVIGQDIRFKSPGNGALLQVLLGKCSDETNINMICSSLAHEVDGIYNDLLGKSTIEMEDSMIEDANYVRSLSDTSFSYTHLTGFDITRAYYTNYAELFRLLARLRAGGSDYFVPILQRQLNFTGLMQNRQNSDSTKLMSIFNEAKYQKAVKDTKNSNSTLISRVDGGLFFCLRRDFTAGRNASCPFSDEIAEISEIYSMYGNETNNSIFMPLGFQSNQLTHLNQHTPITVRFLSDGTVLPQQAKPFKGNDIQLNKLGEFRRKVFDFIVTEALLTKLSSYVGNRKEYEFACKICKRMRVMSGKNQSIYTILNYIDKLVIIRKRSS